MEGSCCTTLTYLHLKTSARKGSTVSVLVWTRNFVPFQIILKHLFKVELKR